MRNTQTMKVGVVLERRRIDNPWQDYAWRPVAVIPAAPEVAQPRLLMREGPIELYHAATLPIELFPSDTEGYRYNLSQAQPCVYVVLRSDDPAGAPRPFHVTMCPYEAQDYSEGSSDIVDGVPAPDAILAWVADYVARYHVDEPFKKRERQPFDPRKGGGRGGAQGHG
ncbi:MAG: DUF3305 domain-containing protein [Rhodospirillales bacterium]|nr:DUF3305 domain-containing protein [Rhodospirillales bacterium]